MEENEYKSTYNELASVPCVFEKALSNKQAKCNQSRHFCLADREGYSCKNAELSVKCRELVRLFREKSTFVLKLHEINGPLPHNMEIRVQAGGVMGLAKSLGLIVENPSKQPVVNDISGVLTEAIDKYGSLDNLPFSEIIQSVEQFQGRRRRQH